MLAPKAKDRSYMWEIQMDLYETFKPYDSSIPDLEEDLCIPPPFEKGPVGIHDQRPKIQDKSETPLHRAAKKNNRKRTIRLWELRWPLSLPDINGETPLDIMKRSENTELRTLEDDVKLMVKAARIGNIGEIKELFSWGLDPLMRLALYAAITSFQIEVIDFLLESRAEEQLAPGLLHAAARVGFVEALDRILKYCPDVNVPTEGYKTALHLGVKSNNADVVRLLLKNKAQVLPPRNWLSRQVETPLHIARRGEIMNLLLEADDGHECLERKNAWGNTPLLEVAVRGYVSSFETLLQHGASVHAVSPGPTNLVRIIALNGRHDLLRQCIEKFSLEELEYRHHNGGTPLEDAQENGHKEVAQLLKSYIRQARRSGGSNSGVPGVISKWIGKF